MATEIGKERNIRKKKPLTRSRFTIVLTFYFFAALIIHNCVLSKPEYYSGWSFAALILIPL